MANERHIEILRQYGDGGETWNVWRIDQPQIQPDLSGADLSEMNLIGADLSGADLSRANLWRSYLSEANFNRANLSHANLLGASLSRADLSGADLSGANLIRANLSDATLSHANLSDCMIYGISAWNVTLDGATQTNLRITRHNESAIMVDNLEVAQFLYLLLHNEKARGVLDTITSKVVLILGRFGEHKATLDALREALRNHTNGYIPVLFDFQPQVSRSILETVLTLASLARFVIVDLSEPNMTRSEVTEILKNVPSVPVQPVIEGETDLPPEYVTWERFPGSFLPLYRYPDLRQLLANLTESVIMPAEGHVHTRRIFDGSGR